MRSRILLTALVTVSLSVLCQAQDIESELAAATNATVLLKGPLTIIATPDGRTLAIGRGDARLAVAGSGDVLAGAIAALAAGGLEPAMAAPSAFLNLKMAGVR